MGLTCSNAVSIEGANVRKECKSGMASVTWTVSCPTCVLDSDAWLGASADDVPSNSPLTEDEGYFAE